MVAMETLKTNIVIEHPDYVNGMNRLALRILSQDQKVYTISSLQDKEGKTTLVANLALALERLQKKVCVVDVDMLTNKEKSFDHSLVSYLSGIDELSQIIIKENDFDSINSEYSTTSATLLSSKRFTEMVEHLKKEYDVVLLDTPSLETHVDAMLVAQTSDALILVVEEARNTKSKLESLLLILKRNNITVLGTVLNKISNPRSLGYKPSVNKGSEAY